MRKGRLAQIFLKADFAINQSKVKGSAQEIQFLGINWQNVCYHIPVDVKNKITAVSPPTNAKETLIFFRHCGLLENAHFKLQSDYKPSLSNDLEEKLFQMEPSAMTSL